MHEFAIAQSILETALTEAKKHNGQRIFALGVKLGKLSHIEPESLEFCLRAVAKGTLAEEARIEIKPLEGSEVFLESLEVADARITNGTNTVLTDAAGNETNPPHGTG